MGNIRASFMKNDRNLLAFCDCLGKNKKRPGHEIHIVVFFISEAPEKTTEAHFGQEK